MAFTVAPKTAPFPQTTALLVGGGCESGISLEVTLEQHQRRRLAETPRMTNRKLIATGPEREPCTRAQDVGHP